MAPGWSCRGGAAGPALVSPAEPLLPASPPHTASVPSLDGSSPEGTRSRLPSPADSFFSLFVSCLSRLPVFEAGMKRKSPLNVRQANPGDVGSEPEHVFNWVFFSLPSTLG